MNIVFMGSAAFAIAPLSGLLQSRHKVKLVVTQPDKPANRGQKIKPCPLAEYAKESELEILKPEKIKNNSSFFERLKEIKPDAIVVVAYGKILPKEVLTIPSIGCINIHASLLPKYRGAAPINWAIVNGERATGVTTMFISERMDEGDILLQCSTEIGEHDTSEFLHDHLTAMGAELLLKTLDRIEDHDLKGIPQDHKEATYAPILAKKDGLIDWTKRAYEIYNRVRGLKPWPRAYTYIDGKQLTIYDAAVIETGRAGASGTIISLDRGITVETGDGQLCLLEVQLEGKRCMSATEFVRGCRLKVGDKL